MRKKQEKIMEDMTFQSIEEAQDFYFASVQRENKRKIALILAGLGTAGTLVSAITGNSAENIFMTIFLFLEMCAPLLGIIAYVLAGGFKDAFMMALKVGKFGYIICPIILVDLAVGFATILVSLMAFLYAPVLFVYLSVKRAKKCQRQALDYLTEQGVIVGVSDVLSQAEPPAKSDAARRSLKAENAVPIQNTVPIQRACENETVRVPKVEYDVPFRVSIEEKDTTAGTMKVMPQMAAEEYQFCGFCGAKLKRKTRFCIVCGKKTED